MSHDETYKIGARCLLDGEVGCTVVGLMESESDGRWVVAIVRRDDGRKVKAALCRLERVRRVSVLRLPVATTDGFSWSWVAGSGMPGPFVWGVPQAAPSEGA